MTGERTCFIIMPLTTPAETVSTYLGDQDHFRHVLEHLFMPAVEKAGYKPLPPVSSGSDVIHAEIVRQLEESQLVLCDLSILNANVFFELGIRTAVDKPVCLVVDSKLPKLPFDIAGVNTLVYDESLSAWSLPMELERIAAHLISSDERSGSHNTLWTAYGLTSRASFKYSDEAGTDEKLNFLITEVESLSRRIGGPDYRRTQAEANFGDLLEALSGAMSLDTLSPIETELMARRFGLEPFSGPSSLDDVGAAMGLTRERVRQIEAQVILKLRSP